MCLHRVRVPEKDDDTLVARMEANHPHLATQRSLYAEISRARDWTELVTNDKAALQVQFEGVTGERIAASRPFALSGSTASSGRRRCGADRRTRKRRTRIGGAQPRIGAGDGIVPHAEGCDRDMEF